MGAQAGVSALSIGGSLIGSYFGPVGAAIGGMAGGLIGSMLFNRAAKPLIPDTYVSTGSYGRNIPIVYGQARVSGTVFWETQVKVQEHGAGKGGGQQPTSFWQSAAISMCEGPANILKIWLDGKIFYDNTSTAPHELTKHTFAIRQYPGDEIQLQDPLIASWVAQNVIPGEACPAYRGLCYMVFQQVDLANYGQRFPQVSVLVSSATTVAIVSKQMIRWSKDVSSDTSLAGPYQTGVAVDWVRDLIYQRSNNDTLRVYDIVSGACVMARRWTNTIPSGQSVGIGAMAVAQGGNLYAVSGDPARLGPFAWTQPCVWTIDPNSLNVLNTVALSTTNADHAGGLPDDFINNMVAFTLLGISSGGTSAGSMTLLAGTWFLGAGCIIDPAGGYVSGELDPSTLGLDATTQIIVGASDLIAGTVDLWWVGSNVLAADYAAVYRSVVGFTPNPLGPDPSTQPLGATFGYTFDLLVNLTADRYGVATPDFYQPNPMCVYDSTDNTLIISDAGLNAAVKITTSGQVITGRPPFPSGGIGNSGQYYTTDAGRVGGSLWTLDNYTGAETDYSSYEGLPFIQGNPLAYNSTRNAIVLTNSGTDDIWVAYLGRLASGEVAVAGIISDLCLRAGLTAGQFDVSAVTDTTVGYTVADGRSAGACISDLCHTYQLDMVESDYTLKFIPRGGAPAVSLTQADLASADSGDLSAFWQEKEALEQEMPLQINVRYSDPNLDYQPGSAYAKRVALPVPTQFSRRIKTVDLPVVATSVEARQIAERWLYTMWAERKTYKTTLSPKYLYLDPGDNVAVALDTGDHYTVRISSVDIGADYTMQLNLSSEDMTTYAPSQSPGAVYGAVPQVLIPSPQFNLFLLNVPLLQDSDDLGGTQTRIYYAAGANAPANVSDNGLLYKSTDGANYPQFDAIQTFVAWGHAMQALGNTVAPFCTDYTNTLQVHIAAGSTAPVSVSYVDLMNGLNAALVGQEIIQFQTVVENTDGTYTLSTLVRGRRGTDWATGTHLTGELFILLNSGMHAGRLALAEINQSEFWRLISSGRTPEETPVQSFAYKGYDLMPYAPVYLRRAASGSDVALSWTRRTRIGGWQQDGIDTVALAEETEAYEAYLLTSAAALAHFDPTVPASYKRRFLSLTAPTVTYTAAMMTTDGFVPATQTAYLVVYQISAVVGRGFRGYAALPAF